MQDQRDLEASLRKKLKKLQKERKELRVSLQSTTQDAFKLKEYYGSLVDDLELKLREMIDQNKNLENEYIQFKHDQ